MTGLTILFGLLGLGIIIFIHELGHFLAAKANGIEVETFSLGWGRKLIGFERGGTSYQISWFPLGGYCKLKGEALKSDLDEESLNRMRTTKGSFLAAPPWRRAVVLAAGPAFNVVFAIIFLSLIWWIGYRYPSTDNRIILVSEYRTESQNAIFPADQAGLETGDRIVSINDLEIRNFTEISDAIRQNGVNPLKIAVERQSSPGMKPVFRELVVSPEKDPDTGMARIGIYAWTDPVVGRIEKTGPAAIAGLKRGDVIVTVAEQEIQHSIDFYEPLEGSPESLAISFLRDNEFIKVTLFPLYSRQDTVDLGFSFDVLMYRSPSLRIDEALVLGVSATWEIVRSTVEGLGRLIRFQVDGLDVAGPVRLTEMVGQAATGGFKFGIGTGLAFFFRILSVLSVAIALMNLLPIPALDGGQLIMTFWEAVRRKPIKARIIFRFQIAGFVIIIMIFVAALMSDIVFLIGR